MSMEHELKSILSVHEVDDKLTPEQYAKRYFFDFVIFGQARSGTHLIATLLNSHPEIACEGEVPITGFRDPHRGYSTVSWDIIKASAGSLPPKGRIRGCICHYIHQQVFINQEGYRPGLWVHLVRNPIDNARSLLKRWDALREGDGTIPPHFTDRKNVPIQADPPEDRLEMIAKETDRATRYNVEFLQSMQSQGQLRFMNLSYDQLTEGKSVTEVSNIHTHNLLQFLGCEDTMLTLRTPIIKQSGGD